MVYKIQMSLPAIECGHVRIVHRATDGLMVIVFRCDLKNGEIFVEEILMLNSNN